VRREKKKKNVKGESFGLLMIVLILSCEVETTRKDALQEENFLPFPKTQTEQLF